MSPISAPLYNVCVKVRQTEDCYWPANPLKSELLAGIGTKVQKGANIYFVFCANFCSLLYTFHLDVLFFRVITKMFGNFWSNVVILVNFWSFNPIHVQVIL